MEGTCQLCGKSKPLEKHHIDYEKNIIVKICKTCHRKVESVLRKIPSEPLKKPVKVICDKCGHTWIYKGKNPFLVTCPSCQLKTKVKK